MTAPPTTNPSGRPVLVGQVETLSQSGEIVWPAIVGIPVLLVGLLLLLLARRRIDDKDRTR
ncbi:MAG: LPXTG cell wall anchor domain-containing protein [Candidatus Dormiibacterota bacterium]